MVAQWYRHREREHGVRVAWRVPVAAGAGGLFFLVALFAAPAGQATFTTSWWQGLLTPLLAAAAAIALGVIERSPAITLSGLWMTAVAWQFCATGLMGGLLGWQAWVLGGGSGPALGGQLTVLGLDHPAPALLLMTLPLAVTGLVHAVRARSAG